nr:MAG TPA: hypothetical protein [Caudoviricetes sp.]
MGRRYHVLFKILNAFLRYGYLLVWDTDCSLI